MYWMNSTACSPKIIIPDLYNRPSSSDCANGAMQKIRRRAVVYVIPRFANNLYNRSSAVDSSFYNQPQVGKPTWGYNYPTALRRLPSVIGHHLPKTHPSSSDCANGAMRKTAEERFNMLARGWLAYPVTPTHAHLPPKSGCINAIPACANGALLLATPPARRGGTPSLCASEMRYFPLSAQYITIEKTVIPSVCLAP